MVFEIGDWNCKHCNEHNFKKRDRCYKCKKPKGTISNNNTNVYKYELGDWICRHCSKSNFKKRTKCFGCKKDRDSQSDQSSSNSQTECVICLDKPRNKMIKNCRHFVLCDTCCFAINKCPLCRGSFDPDKDLETIYT